MRPQILEKYTTGVLIWGKLGGRHRLEHVIMLQPVGQAHPRNLMVLPNCTAQFYRAKGFLFFLFSINCRSPATEAGLLQTSTSIPTDMAHYREELMLSLSSARDLASKNIVKAQEKYMYRHHYDLKVRQRDFKINEWMLIEFPKAESG